MIQLVDILTPALQGSDNYLINPDVLTQEDDSLSSSSDCFYVASTNPSGNCFYLSTTELDCFSIGSEEGVGAKFPDPVMPTPPPGETWTLVGIISNGYARTKAIMKKEGTPTGDVLSYLDMSIDINYDGIISYGVFSSYDFEVTDGFNVSGSQQFIAYSKATTVNQFLNNGGDTFYDLNPSVLSGEQTLLLYSTYSYVHYIAENTLNAGALDWVMRGRDIKTGNVFDTDIPSTIKLDGSIYADVLEIAEQEGGTVVMGRSDRGIFILHDAYREYFAIYDVYTWNSNSVTIIEKSTLTLAIPKKLEVLNNIIGYCTGSMLYLFEVGNPTPIQSIVAVTDFTFFNNEYILYLKANSATVYALNYL